MIITISRQFGSGGNRVGRLVAEQLGMPFYDKNIINHVADKLGFSPEYVKQVQEKPTGSFLFSMAMYSYGNAATDSLIPAEMRVSTAQTEFILEKAAAGSGVFVGRCSDYILRERDDVFSVFIYADMDIRTKNIMDRYGISEKEAIKIIQQTDKRRAMFYNTNTHHRWGDKESYHLMLDIGKLGFDATVEAVEYCARLYLDNKNK